VVAVLRGLGDDTEVAVAAISAVTNKDEEADEEADKEAVVDTADMAVATEAAVAVAI